MRALISFSILALFTLIHIVKKILCIPFFFLCRQRRRKIAQDYLRWMQELERMKPEVKTRL